MKGLIPIQHDIFKNSKDNRVHDSEIIVNFNQNGQIQSLYNNYHYGIPSELDPKNILITKDEVTKIVNDLFKSVL